MKVLKNIHRYVCMYLVDILNTVQMKQMIHQTIQSNIGKKIMDHH